MRAAPYLLIATALALSSGALAAPPPPLLSYQGVLMDDQGIVVPDGAYTLEFALHTDATASSLVFDQTLSVEVRKGIYNVVLSSNGMYDLPTVIATNSNLFMEVTVLQNGGSVPTDIVLAPRQQLASVPYALTADGSAGGTCYTSWGEPSCAAPFVPVVTGHIGGYELFSSANSVGWDTPRAHPQCVADSAPTVSGQAYQPSWANRLFRGVPDGQAVDQVETECATCCTGGCFVGVGLAQCPNGYATVVEGHLGGIEGKVPSTIGAPLCISSNLNVERTLTITGTSNRSFLFRYGPTGAGGGAGNPSNGMTPVENRCVQCCKVN